MAYRKYLKINNKIYGPYIYKSKRVGNKVTTEYVGKHTEQEETKLTTKPNFNFKVLWIIFPILLVLFSALFFVVFYPRFTGRVGLEQALFQDNKSVSENITEIISEPTENITQEVDLIEINTTEENITIPEIPENITEPISELPVEETTISEIPTIPETITPEIPIVGLIIENATITTEQSQARIGQPVQWKTQVKLEQEGIVKVELPSIAENISVYKIYGELIEEIEEIKKGTMVEKLEKILALELKIKELKEKFSSLNQDLSELEELEEKLLELKRSLEAGEIEIKGKEREVEITREKLEVIEVKEKVSEENIEITGKVISGKISAEIDLEKKPKIIRFFIKIFRNIKERITGKVIITEEIPEKEIIEVTIEENATEYNVEYITPAPQAIENITGTGKIIVVSGPDEVHYENITAFTILEKEKPESQVKLYWLINNSRQLIQTTKYDFNNNSLIDYIEWQVPSLSTQTYELVIEITKAEHLDENRNFISDIYPQVRAKDDVWSEMINNSEYIRVTFQQALTSNRDITLYARSLTGVSSIEVYRKEDNVSIAKFDSISSENWYKVYLTNLQEGESYETFDLKVFGSVEIDYIVDPTTVAGNESSDPTSVDDWPMFRRSLNRTGYTSASAPSNISNAEVRNFTVGSAVRSSPAVANGYVYIGSDDDKVYQLNASNVSQHIANYTTSGDVRSSPAVNDLYVYVGSNDGKVYQLNASNVSQHIANFSTGGTRVSSPAVANGYVYISEGTPSPGVGTYTRHTLVQLNATNVNQLINRNNLTCVGCDNPPTTLGDNMAPTVANGYVYFGSRSSIEQFDATNISLPKINSMALPEQPSDLAQVTGHIIATSNYVYVVRGGILHQLDATNTSIMVSNFTFGESIASSPAVANSYVYIGGGSGTAFFYQFNASNVSQQIANFSVGYSISSSPAVTTQYVYVGTSGTAINFLQLNASNVSHAITSYDTHGGVESSPAISNGSVYFGNIPGVIYQFNGTPTVLPDTTPPTINITFPLNNTNHSTSSLHINYTVSDTALNAVWWTNNSGTTNWTLANGVNITNQTWAEGNYLVIVYANDTSNNRGSSAVNFTIDLTKPLIWLKAPANGTSQSTLTAWIEGNFTDNNALENATVFVWNQTLSLVNSSENRTITGIANSSNISITLPYDATFFWNYFVCDNAGNCNMNNTNFTLTISSVVPPQISNVRVVSSSADSAVIAWDTNEAANSSIYYGTTQATTSFKGSSSLVISHEITVYYLQDNTFYYYNVSGCDAAGNCNTSIQYNFTTPALKARGTGTTPLILEECSENWQCSDWSECLVASTSPLTGMVTGFAVSTPATPACNENELRCHETNPNYYQKCVKKRNSLQWSSYRCPKNLACVGQGECSCSTDNSCQEQGQKECKGNDIYECKKDSSNCLKWTRLERCAAGLTCSGGKCVCSEYNSCEEGEERCYNLNRFQTCQINLQGCLKWGTQQLCAKGEVCADGECIKGAYKDSDVCKIGEKTCMGNDVYECQNYKNRYNIWKRVKSCPKNLACVGQGECSCSILNSCNEFETRCSSGTTIQTCQKDVQGCLKWGSSIKCKTGEKCANNECVKQHCLNQRKDADEEGIDCGGKDCKPCLDEYRNLLGVGETREITIDKGDNISVTYESKYKNKALLIIKRIDADLSDIKETHYVTLNELSEEKVKVIVSSEPMTRDISLKGTEIFSFEEIIIIPPAPQPGFRTRTCTDLSNCNTNKNKPIELLSCEAECPEIWKCDDWTACISGVQTRNCIEVNLCGTIKNKPETTRTCGEACKENWQCEWSECKLEEAYTGSNDFNKDGKIDFADFTIYTSYYGSSSCNEKNNYCNYGDFDRDGDVDFNDYIKFVSQYGSAYEGEKRYYSYPTNCVDKNKCNTEYDKPRKSLCSIDYEKETLTYIPGCSVDWSCEKTEECKLSYNLKDLIENKSKLEGIQYMRCVDLNKCIDEKVWETPCDISAPISARKIKWCEEDYLEIKDIATGELISRVKYAEIEGIQRLDIGFIVSNFTGYCDYCYNRIQDYDEEGVDCGGSCPPCIEYVYKERFSWWIYLAWLWWLLLLLLILYLIYRYVRDKYEKRKRKKQEKLN